eukprot:8573689-Karenia_brevis.AAC.1
MIAYVEGSKLQVFAASLSLVALHHAQCSLVGPMPDRSTPRVKKCRRKQKRAERSDPKLREARLKKQNEEAQRARAKRAKEMAAGCR